jgi:hypothetical protein
MAYSAKSFFQSVHQERQSMKQDPVNDYLWKPKLDTEILNVPAEFSVDTLK